MGRDDTWLESKPPEIREAYMRYPPDMLYRLRTTGQIVFIRSYMEANAVALGKCQWCKRGIQPGHSHLAFSETTVSVIPAGGDPNGPRIWGIKLTDLEEIPQ